MAVLLYQIGILIAIQVSAFFGRGARNVAIGLISIFTLLQVFASWLMILQFATIFISYLISEGILDKSVTAEKKQVVPKENIGREFGQIANTPTSTDNYGKNAANPILMSSIPSSFRFLDKIVEENKCLNYVRVGSTKHGNFQNPIDIYKFSKDGQFVTELFIYPYYNSNIEIIPERLKNIC